MPAPDWHDEPRVVPPLQISVKERAQWEDWNIRFDQNTLVLKLPPAVEDLMPVFPTVPILDIALPAWLSSKADGSLFVPVTPTLDEKNSIPPELQIDFLPDPPGLDLGLIMPALPA